MQRKTRAALQTVVAVLVILGAFELTLALSERLLRPLGQTVAASNERIAGPLMVGAATHRIDLSPREPLAGFGLLRPPGRGWAGPPWEARAIVIGKLAIVSLDVLEIPAALSAVVSERLGPNLTVWLCATHTHSGPGGYDPERLPQLVGARRFEPGVFDALAEAATAAVSAAAWGARPATVRWSRSAHPELQVGRTPGATPDPSMWALQARDEEDRPIATLAGFGSHPTLVSRAAAMASADWPGAAAAALDESSGVGIVVQTAGGDSSARRPPGPANTDFRAAYGLRVAQAALQSLAASPSRPIFDEDLALAPAHITWDLGDLLHVRLPGTIGQVNTVVRIAKLDGLWLVCLPGELTGAAWKDLETREPALEGAWPISLCGDELSYVESPRLIEARTGERLVVFPDAVPQLAAALASSSATLPR